MDPTDDLVGTLGPKRLLWVDVGDRGDGAAMATARRMLDLSDDDIERIKEDTGRARLTRMAERLYLTLESVEADDATPPQLQRREIDLIAAPNIVLTIHDGPVIALQRYREGLEGETRLGLLTAGDLMSSLVDEIIVGYFLLAELIEREIDALDQRALHGRPGDDILGDTVALRRRIGLVRRTLAPHREALSTLALPEMDVEESVGRPWPGLVDRVEAAMSAVEGLREGLIGTFDIHMGRVSQRANDVMKILTLLSAVLLPAVVLAGVMGMNFKLGFFDEPSNFLWVVGSMAVLAIGILAVARARRWL